MYKLISVSEGFQTSSSSNHCIVKLRNFSDSFYGKSFVETPESIFKMKASKLQYILSYLGKSIVYSYSTLRKYLEKNNLMEVFNNYDERSRIEDENIKHTIIDNIHKKYLPDLLISIIEDPRIRISEDADRDIKNLERAGIIAVDFSLNDYILKVKDTQYGFALSVFRISPFPDRIRNVSPSIKVLRFTKDTNILHESSEFLLDFYKNCGKLDSPDFIDLKITNYCENECSYCYQKSSVLGKHADKNLILEALDMFDSNNVLQVAIGGGEPTCHPDFEQIFHTKSPVKNITTRNITKCLSLIDEYNEIPTGIGYTLDYENFLDLKKVSQLLSNVHEKITLYWNTYIYFHIIPELHNKVELETLFNNIPTIREEIPANAIVLLGLKPTRLKIKTYQHDWNEVFSFLKQKTLEDYFPRIIYVDTCLARKTKHILQFQDHCFWYTHEGIISKYVDLVEKFVSPSSYETDKRIYFNTIEELEKLLTEPIYTY